jgi:protein-disulfide isomerase
MENTSKTKSVLTWAGFIVIVGLIVWGMIAAQNKADRQSADLILPNQIVATDHIKGNETALVTMVEYGDFQCPACGAYFSLVEKVLADMGPNKVRFVFRHFPLMQHANAVPAAEASEAAGAQGKFWEMYKMIYENQKVWSESTNAKSIFEGYAKTLGLDMSKYVADLDSEAIRAVIKNNYEGGIKAGINSTPTFFINGEQVKNLNSYEDFKKAIESAVPKLNS